MINDVLIGNAGHEVLCSHDEVPYRVHPALSNSKVPIFTTWSSSELNGERNTTMRSSRRTLGRGRYSPEAGVPNCSADARTDSGI